MLDLIILVVWESP